MKKGLSLTVLFLVGILTACGSAVTAEPASNHVLVLVVDTFTLEETQSTDQSSQSAVDTNSVVCAETPDGQGVYGGRNPKPATKVINDKPHGYAVYKELINSIPTNERGNFDPRFDQYFENFPWIKQADYLQVGDGIILFVAVDTNSLNTDSIIANTQKSIDTFTSSEVTLGEVTYPVFNNVVVNMSFAYVPCGDPTEYIKTPLSMLNDTLGLNLTPADMASLDALGRAYYNGKDTTENNFYNHVNLPCEYSDKEKCVNVDRAWSGVSALFKNRFNFSYDEEPDLVAEAMFEAFVTYLVYSPDNLTLDGDAYDRFLDENDVWISNARAMMNKLAENYPDVVFVASAGNSNFPYPYLPALLDSFISVSSEGTDESRPCLYSLDGGSNCGEVVMNGVYFADPDVTGTSMAAPKLSYVIALHLLNGGNGRECITPNGQTIHPVIGYSDGTGPWDNRTVDDVKMNICTSFTP
jgi:hypothetical protein